MCSAYSPFSFTKQSESVPVQANERKTRGGNLTFFPRGAIMGIEMHERMQGWNDGEKKV